MALRTFALLVAAIGAAGCGPSADAPNPLGGAGEWLELEGSWTAAGERRSIPLGAERRAAALDLRGTMLLSAAGRPGVGFRSDVVALSDSATGLQGRGVWTDERGDEVWSELVGEGTAADNRITGSIVGGSGRYAGATGTYAFRWQFVTETEDGRVQGRAVDLRVRVRVGGSAQ